VLIATCGVCAEVYDAQTKTCLVMHAESWLYLLGARENYIGRDPRKWWLGRNYSNPHASHRWPLKAVLGIKENTYEGVKSYLLIRPLIVTIILVNKHTHKKAVLYYSGRSQYVEVAEDRRCIMDSVGQVVVVKESGHALHTKLELMINKDDDDDDDYQMSFSRLIFDGPRETSPLDIYHWFKSLQWM